MRYSPTPSTFPVAYWRELWENNINDIEQLRAPSSTTGIIAIDMDPHVLDGKTTHESITEFGIAFLPPSTFDQRPCIPSPPSLDAIVQHFSIQSHSLRIIDRNRTDRNRETYRYGSGELQAIPADQVEDAALTIINSFTSGPKPILVGFSMAYELGILTKFYPRLLTGCFSAWKELTGAVWSATPAHHSPVKPLTGRKEFVEHMRRRQYSEEAQVVRRQRGKKKAEHDMDELVIGLSFEGDGLEQN